MGIYRNVENKLAGTIAGVLVQKDIKIIPLDVNQIANLINKHFIIGASEEEFTTVKKYIRRELGLIKMTKPLTTKDGFYMLNIKKQPMDVEVLFYDDSVKGKRNLYQYKKRSYKEFLNAMNVYLEPEIYAVQTNPSVPTMQNISVNNGNIAAEEKISCSFCGAEINKGTKFCPECGSPTERHCPKCNAIIAGTPKFCPECGEKL